MIEPSKHATPDLKTYEFPWKIMLQILGNSQQMFLTLLMRRKTYHTNWRGENITLGNFSLRPAAQQTIPRQHELGSSTSSRRQAHFR